MRSGAAPQRSKPTSVSVYQRALDLDLPTEAADAAARSRDHPKQEMISAPAGFPLAAAVAAFHAAFDLPRQALPCVDVGEKLSQLRVALLEEEVGEFVAATHARDLVGIADALGDIVYVAYGAALTYGIDLDLVLAEVHRANMSKLDSRGQPVKRADGKVVKSERYRPPDVRGALQQQLPLQLA